MGEVVMGVGGSQCCVDALLLHQKERQALNLRKKLQCLAIAISALMLLPTKATTKVFPPDVEDSMSDV